MSTKVLYLSLIAGIVIALNILGNSFFTRLDFTEDKRYTLSDATKNILAHTQETVTITAYFSEDLPLQVDMIRDELRDILTEYESAAKGNLVYEFIDPTDDEELKQEASRNGIEPLYLGVQDKDKTQQQNAYIGLVIKMGGQSESIPAILAVPSIEYALTTAIKKLSVIDKPLVGFVQGHGEPSTMAMQQVVQSLNVLYDVMPIDLGEGNIDLSSYKTLAIVAPTDTISDNQLNVLDEFLAQGGNLIIAVNRANGVLQAQPPMAVTINTGLETWLEQKGLSVDNNIVIDAQCGQIQVQQQGIPFPIPLDFPYLPVISNFAEHPTTSGLSAIMLQFGSTVSYNGKTSLQFTPLAYTSEMSDVRPLPEVFDVNHQWSETDFAQQSLPVAALLSGNIVGTKMQSKIILIGDGDFAISGEGQVAAQQPDNINFMVNAIDWLSDDSGLIELRTQGISMRPIDPMDDSKISLLKYLNFLLPVLLVLLYGLIRWQMNKMKRLRRMRPGVL